MAKKSMIEREKKRSRTVAKFARKRAELLKQINDESLDDETRWNARIRFQKLPRDASPVRQVSRCALTGRPKGFYRKFGLGRNKLREMAMKGYVPGIVKSSW